MLVVSRSVAGIMLRGGDKRYPEDLPTNRLTMIIDDKQPTHVLVPYDIWFQVQHFVSMVLERNKQ